MKNFLVYTLSLTVLASQVTIDLNPLTRTALNDTMLGADTNTD